MRLLIPFSEAKPLCDIAISLGVALGPDEWGDDGISLYDYFQLTQQIALKLRDETGSLSSRSLLEGSTDFVIDTMMTADNLEGAMHHAARTYNLLHGGNYNHVERRRDRIAFVINDRGFPHVFDRDSGPVQAAMEGVLISVHALLSAVAGSDLTEFVRIVRTRRPKHDPSNGLLAFWTVSVRCGSTAYALEYDLATASLPIRKDAFVARAANVNEMLFALIQKREQMSLPPGFPTRVRNAIGGGVHEQDDVARLLGVSTATLRRRLAESGLSFRDLRASVLNENAQTMLRDGRSSADVAQTLGFTDVRSFSRAFKDWNGMTPAAFTSTIRDAIETT